MSWVITLTSTPETKAAAQEQTTGAEGTAPQPAAAPLLISEMNHPDCMEGGADRPGAEGMLFPS